MLVSFKKDYKNGQPSVTKEIMISAQDLQKGLNLKELSYPALGLSGENLIQYNYRVSWSFKGDQKPINFPSNPDIWLESSEAAIPLIPPFDKKVIEIDLDRTTFVEGGIKSGTIRFFTILNGEPQVQKSLVFRDTDPESTNTVALYFDHKQTGCLSG